MCPCVLGLNFIFKTWNTLGTCFYFQVDRIFDGLNFTTTIYSTVCPSRFKKEVEKSTFPLNNVPYDGP